MQQTLADYDSSENSYPDPVLTSDPPDTVPGYDIEGSDYVPTESTRFGTESMDVPTPCPTDRVAPGDPVGTVNPDEFRAAVAAIVDATDEILKSRHERIQELPRWLDDEDIPAVTDHQIAGKGPDYCNHCGIRHPWDQPLEQGRVLALEGNDGNPVYDACPPGKYNIRRCECCGCPHCGAKSIRFRKSKEPDYACGHPDCKAEFSHPVERPIDLDMTDARERLYWECKNCGEPTLAPFTGIPDEFLF